MAVTHVRVVTCRWSSGGSTCASGSASPADARGASPTRPPRDVAPVEEMMRNAQKEQEQADARTVAFRERDQRTAAAPSRVGGTV